MGWFSGWWFQTFFWNFQLYLGKIAIVCNTFQGVIFLFWIFCCNRNIWGDSSIVKRRKLWPTAGSGVSCEVHEADSQLGVDAGVTWVGVEQLFWASLLNKVLFGLFVSELVGIFCIRFYLVYLFQSWLESFARPFEECPTWSPGQGAHAQSWFASHSAEGRNSTFVISFFCGQNFDFDFDHDSDFDTAEFDHDFMSLLSLIMVLILIIWGLKEWQNCPHFVHDLGQSCKSGAHQLHSWFSPCTMRGSMVDGSTNCSLIAFDQSFDYSWRSVYFFYVGIDFPLYLELTDFWGCWRWCDRRHPKLEQSVGRRSFSDLWVPAGEHERVTWTFCIILYLFRSMVWEYCMFFWFAIYIMFSFIELNPGKKQEPWSFAITGTAGMSRLSDASRQRSRKSSPTITLWPVDGSLTNILSQAFVLSFLILWYVNYFVLCGFVFVAKHFVLSFLILWYVNYFVLCAFVFFGFETYCQETCFGPCSTRWWGGEWWGEREEECSQTHSSNSSDFFESSSFKTTTFFASSSFRLISSWSFKLSRLISWWCFKASRSWWCFKWIGASRSCDASWKMVFKVCWGLLGFFKICDVSWGFCFLGAWVFGRALMFALYSGWSSWQTLESVSIYNGRLWRSWMQRTSIPWQCIAWGSCMNHGASRVPSKNMKLLFSSHP